MVVLGERLLEGQLACHFDMDIPWEALLLQEDEVQILHLMNWHDYLKYLSHLMIQNEQDPIHHSFGTF